MYNKASVRSVFVCSKTKCIIYGDAIRQMEDRINNENDVRLEPEQSVKVC